MTPRRRERTAARRALRRLTTTLNGDAMTDDHTPATSSGWDDPSARLTALALVEAVLRDGLTGDAGAEIDALLPTDDDETTLVIEAAVRLIATLAAGQAAAGKPWADPHHHPLGSQVAALTLDEDAAGLAALLDPLDRVELLSALCQYLAWLILAVASHEGWSIAAVFASIRSLIVADGTQR